MKRIIAWIAALLMALSFTPAVSAEGTVLKVGHTTRLNGNFFSDLFGNNSADIDVRSLLHEYPLVAWTNGGDYRLNATVISQLSKQKEKDGDVTYTVTLKPNLRYSDGSDIKAADYVFTFLLLSSPQMKDLAGITANFSYLKGFEEYSGGVVPVFSGIRISDELTFSLTIKASYLPYFYELAYINAYPLPIQELSRGCVILDEGEGAEIRGPFDTAALRQALLDPETGYLSHPKVTSGPYRLTSYDDATHVAEFEINPYYLGNYEGQRPSIPRLQFQEVRNQTMLAELTSGKINLINKVTDGSVIDEGLALCRNDVISYSDYPRTGSAFLAIANERPITSSVRVRQALAHSLDPEVLPRDFLKHHGEKIYAYYGLGQWMPLMMKDKLDTLPRYPLNLKEAARLLEEDGWVYASDGGAYQPSVGGLRYRRNEAGRLEPLSLKMAVLDENKAAYMVLEMLTENLRKIGGEMTYFNLSLDEALRQYYRQEPREYDILFMGTNFTYFFDPTITYKAGDDYQGTANTSGIRDLKLETLAANVTRVPAGDRVAFLKRWFAFQQYWAKVLPMIPLYSNTYFDLYTKDLVNYHPESYWNWATAILYAELKR